eukprot:COSAG06_NODE_42_length_29897_cov_42.547721_20_plen_71_part_00
MRSPISQSASEAVHAAPLGAPTAPPFPADEGVVGMSQNRGRPRKEVVRSTSTVRQPRNLQLASNRRAAHR